MFPLVHFIVTQYKWHDGGGGCSVVLLNYATEWVNQQKNAVFCLDLGWLRKLILLPASPPSSYFLWCSQFMFLYAMMKLGTAGISLTESAVNKYWCGGSYDMVGNVGLIIMIIKMVEAYSMLSWRWWYDVMEDFTKKDAGGMVVWNYGTYKNEGECCCGKSTNGRAGCWCFRLLYRVRAHHHLPSAFSYKCSFLNEKTKWS